MASKPIYRIMRKSIKYIAVALLTLAVGSSCQELAGERFEQTQALCVSNHELLLAAVPSESGPYVEHIRIDSAQGWSATILDVELVPDPANPALSIPAVGEDGEWVVALDDEGKTFEPVWCHLQNSTGAAGMSYCHMEYESNLTGMLRYAKFVVTGGGERKVINITQNIVK